MKRVLSYLFMAMTVVALAAGAAYAAKSSKPAAGGGEVEGVEPAEPREPGQEKNMPATGRHAYPADYKPQIVYGKDLVGVTANGTLSCRYRGDWDDPWGKYMESYLAEAKEKAAARGGKPPKKVRFGVPILKNCVVTAGDGTLGGDGKPLRGIYSTPEAQVENYHKEAKKFENFFYAASDGKVVAETVFPVLDGLKVNTGPHKRTFLIWPRGLQDQLLPMLKRYENAGVIEWIFIVAGQVEVQNPAKDAKGKPLGFGRGPFGLSFTGWPLYGGYCMATTAAAAGLWVHEFNHRYLDGLRRHAGVQLTRVHAQGQLGYAPGHNLDEIYFTTYRYAIRPAMWDRFSSTTPILAPLEPFGDKAYEWKDVQDDCWFKTPELHNAELAKLTGINSFEIVVFGGSQRLFTVAAADRSKVLSTYIEPPKPVKAKKGGAPPSDALPPPPVQLDNYIAVTQESCAVVKTSTGTWLFVSANMADLYADMLKISGKGDQQIPVYGYVNEGVLPLLVFKAPAAMPLPTCEEGFFRAPVAGGKAAK